MKPKFKTSRAEIEALTCSTDASQIKGRAQSVVYPKSILEIQQDVKIARNITIRGGGTSLVGGAVPQESVVINLSKMNKVIGINKSKKFVEVEAGIVLDALNYELDKYNLEFPVQPSSHSVCTIGGMIATNAVGSRAIKYGRTANWVEALEVVNAQGELEKIGKTDMSDYTGMEGITGIIVKAKLKLIEKPKRTASVYKFDDIRKVIDITKQLKTKSDVSMVELLSPSLSELLELEKAYHLIVEFESDSGKFKDEAYSKIMELRDRSYPVLASLGYKIIQDPKIFIEKFPEYIDFLDKNKTPYFGHIGVGIIHPCFIDEKIADEALVLAKKLRGSVSGEHGIGLAKKKFLDESEKKLIRVIKKRHDPFSKLNPGKLLDMDIKGVVSVDEKEIIKEEQENKEEEKEKQEEPAKQEEKNGNS